jgi:hypothetical protein
LLPPGSIIVSFFVSPPHKFEQDGCIVHGIS